MVKVFLRADSIEKLLARKNMSQNWLAAKIGISSGYISQLVNGERCPSPKIREKIQDVFKDKKFDDLFYINDDKADAI